MGRIKGDPNCVECGGTGECPTCKGEGEHPQGTRRTCHECCGGGKCRCVVRRFEKDLLDTSREPPRPLTRPLSIY